MFSVCLRTAVLLLLLPVCAARGEDTIRPNILLIITDDSDYEGVIS